jgi:hypothetical protein
LLIGDRVIFRYRDEESIVTQHVGLDCGADRHRSSDTNVDDPVSEPSGLLVGRHRVQFHTDIRPCSPESVEKRRHELIRRRVDEAETEPTPRPDTQLFGCPKHALRRHEELACIGEERLTVDGQRHSSGRALKQRESEVGFELPDLLTQRRLRNVEPRRSPAEVKFVGDGNKCIESTK